MYNSNIIIIKSDIFKQIKLVVPNYYLCKMKPTVISNANSSASGSGNIQNEENGVNIQQQQTQFNPQSQHFLPDEPQSTSYGSPGSLGRGQRQQQTYAQQQQGNPSQFRQDFDFQPDVDMFPRTRLGRMTHDPFGDFGGTTHFGFPQFNSMGRRRVTPHNDDDFFNRLPSEFRQYMPESFAHRRAGSGTTGSLGSNPATVHMQQPTPQPKSHFCNTMPQSSPIKVCDAAIQTEDPNGRSEVDHFINTENIYPHGLRNTVDMGVKSVSENENQNPRSSSAPPTEQQNLEKIIYIQPQQITVNGPNRLPPQHYQFNTQTSPQILSGGYGGQAPQFQTTLTTPHQTHLQQQQQNSPPQTPGGSYIRTIPIFVEGRTEPIINNNEIPNQNAFAGSQESRAHTPPKQQTQRPSPLNTQQTTPQISGIFPQTPHTVDTINKIQDIQRDVLDLMSRVEKFTDTRDNKEYAYLDEMLTRNLLKLDNIDTNGKDSIRLARKEAIKCIQASINVLEAKAEENKKITQVNSDSSEVPVEKVTLKNVPSQKPATETQKSISADKMTKEATSHPADKPIEGSADNKVMEPIPLPPPESEKFNEVKIEDCPDDDVSAPCINEQSLPKIEDKLRNSPEEK